MASIEQHRRPAVGCRELEPTRRGLIRRFHLGDDAGDRAIAQRVFGHRQHVGVLAALGVKDAVGTETDLFEARRVQIEPGQRPQYGEARLAGESSRDTGGEQGCGRIGAQRGGGRRDLMKASPVEPMIGKPVIERRQPERQRRPALALGLRELCAKRG